jgi:hypothetical protein
VKNCSIEWQPAYKDKPAFLLGTFDQVASGPALEVEAHDRNARCEKYAASEE